MKYNKIIEDIEAIKKQISTEPMRMNYCETRRKNYGMNGCIDTHCTECIINHILTTIKNNIPSIPNTANKINDVHCIKIRVWDKDGDGIAYAPKMHYSDQKSPSDILFSLDNGMVQCFKNHVKTDTFGNKHHNWVPFDNLMLYSGFCDIDNTEIYENDIIKFTNDDFFCVVRYDNEKAMFVLDEYGYLGQMKENGWDDYAGEFTIIETYALAELCENNKKIHAKILGNTYENEELLQP